MQQLDRVETVESWNSEPLVPPEDPLLGCLVIMARLHDLRASAESLKAGLPLEDHRLTPELFVRAAARAGLSAKVVKRELSALSDLLLPAVLLLHGKQACVLVRMDGHTTAHIILPESGTGTRQIAIDDLHARYAGFAIFAGPAHRFADVLSDSGVPRPQRWFWDVVVRAWPIYGEVVLASLLINVFALVT